MDNHSIDHQEWLIQELADPELAGEYLTAALEDSPEMFLEAVKNVAQAKHKISELAKQAGITRESMYRSFSSEGNPAFKTFYKLLDILDIGIQFKAKTVRTGVGALIAPALAVEDVVLELPIAANPQRSLSRSYWDESALDAGSQEALYVEKNIRIANSTRPEFPVQDESMGIPDVFMPAVNRNQQQLHEELR